MTKWVIGQPNSEKVSALLKKTAFTRLAAEVLVSRGVDTFEKAESFFAPEELSSPFLLRDMPEAVDVISAAISEGKSICIYGDYDCDGITATVVLYSYLECLGAEVSYYIPERNEGYGMNCAAIRQLAERGVELIITVDNGISAFEEATLIEELGMQLVITDHHQPSDTLPSAAAIVNPHRKDCVSPYKKLCGAGVALKLIAALDITDGGSYGAVMEQFADLVAIGTIADIVMLDGENRTIVEQGLRLLANTENMGLAALLAESKVPTDRISATSVAFMLAPRLNAAGRFGSPSAAVKLLLCEDETEAVTLAAELTTLNNKRKDAEVEILAEIAGQLAENPACLNERVLIFAGKDWHPGVIGIVCSRLVERYGKPTFVLTIDEKSGQARGSARSVDGFSIFDALSAAGDLLVRFGGHKGAGGLTIEVENIPLFVERVASFSKEHFPTMPQLTRTAEKALLATDLTVKAVEGLAALEPFGEGNARPLFALLGARIEEVIPLSEGKHTKLKLSFGGVTVVALLFGKAPHDFLLKKTELGDFLLFLELNSYNGAVSLSLKIADYRKSGITQSKYFAARNTYEAYMRGEGIDAALKPRIIPNREELVTVYTAISPTSTSMDSLFMALSSDSMNFCKLKLCIDIFSDLGLVRYDPVNDAATKLPATKKVDIESSKILIALKNN